MSFTFLCPPFPAKWVCLGDVVAHGSRKMSDLSVEGLATSQA